MSKRLALDIGSRELRLVQADGDRLVGHAEVFLPDGAIVEGVPTPLLSAALRGALENSGFSSSTVRVAISESGTAFRDFQLPRLPARELTRAVAYEGRRLIPMDAAEVYFAWHASRQASSYAVYLVAARRDMIDALVRSVTSAGLGVERIDLKPLALARGVGVSDGLLLEWGAGEATLVLMVSGRPRFFRSFMLDAAAEDVDGQFEELAFSLNALVKFMRGTAPDVSIGPATPLWLAGRFAFLPDGARQAEQRFQFNVRFPAARVRAVPGFPWQAHFAGVGLLHGADWRDRLTPAQGGEIRVAA